MKSKNAVRQYEKPTVKVVTFVVEEGFGSIIGGGGTPSSGSITFGGTPELGRMNHGTGDHSGLGQYGDGSNIFGNTVGD